MWLIRRLQIKHRFSLSQEERDELKGIVAKGRHNSQKVLNALIILNYDEDAPEPRTLGEQEIANVLKVSILRSTVVRGNGHTSERLMAISRHILLRSAAVTPPKGQAQWSLPLRLLADKVVELGYVESVSYETVRRVLKKTKLSLGRKLAGNPHRPQRQFRSSDGAGAGCL